MLTVDIDDFMFELKEGALKHVGPSTMGGEIKLYDVESAEARAFGDNRVKLAFSDGEGNEVEVAVFPEAARRIGEQIATLEDESEVFD